MVMKYANTRIAKALQRRLPVKDGEPMSGWGIPCRPPSTDTSCVLENVILVSSIAIQVLQLFKHRLGLKLSDESGASPVLRDHFDSYRMDAA